MTVEYFARITCSCGTTAECDFYTRVDRYDDVEIDANEPDGWLVKGDAHRCPACVQVWMDTPSPCDLWAVKS